MQQRVAGIARARVPHQSVQHARVAQHGCEAIFTPSLGHFERWLQQQNRRRVEMDVVADHVVDDFCLANLRGGHDHHGFDRWVRQRIHDLALIGCALRQPSTGFGACLTAQLPELVRPLTHLQVRRRCR